MIALLACLTLLAPTAWTEGFEDGLGRFAPLEGKQPLVRSDARAHGGKWCAYSGPPGNVRTMRLVFDEPFAGRFSLWFYDDLAPAKQQTAAVGGSAEQENLLFVCRGGARYCARVGPSYHEVPVARKEGWRRIEWVCDGRQTTLLIDGQPVFRNERMGKLASAMLGSPWDDSTGWYDDLEATPGPVAPAELARLDKALGLLTAAEREAKERALAADEARLATDFRAAPYGGLQAPNALAREYHGRLSRYVRLTQPRLRDWPRAPGCRYHKVDGHLEHAVRQNATVALSYATLLLDRAAYDEQLTGVPYTQLEADAKALVRYLTITHKANELTTGDGRPWGDHWQSALWARFAGQAGWLLWDRLEPRDRLRVARMVEHEADRFNTRPPDSGVKADTKAEENAWNALIIVLAACMFPDHPRQALWTERALVYQLNSFPREADRASDRLVDGKPARARLSAVCVWPDYTLENHHRVHPDYLGCIGLNLWNALCYLPAGRKLPDSLWFNLPECYEVLGWMTAPNGSYYYVNGQDWWPHRHDSPLSLAAGMALLRGDADAARLERAGLDFTARMHARFGDGRLWDAREFNYPNAEEEMMCRYAELYALHRLVPQGPEPVASAAWVQRRLGVFASEPGGFAVHRTADRVVSFAWLNGAMGLVWPAGDDDTWFTSPSERGLTGRIAGPGLDDKAPQTLAHTVTKLPEGVAVLARLARAGGKVVQEVALVSVTGQPVVWIERWTAREAVTVDSLASANLGLLIEDAPGICANQRTLYHAGGRETLLGAGNAKPETRALPGTWANVDGRLGLVVSAPHLAWRGEHRYQRARLEQELVGCWRTNLGAFASGQVIWEGAAAIVPNASPERTAALTVTLAREGGVLTARVGAREVSVDFARLVLGR